MLASAHLLIEAFIHGPELWGFRSPGRYVCDVTRSSPTERWDEDFLACLWRLGRAQQKAWSLPGGLSLSLTRGQMKPSVIHSLCWLIEAFANERLAAGEHGVPHGVPSKEMEVIHPSC